MNQFDHNINKDNMIDSDLIDVESLDFSDEQTWLYRASGDSGEKFDLFEYKLNFDWPLNEDDDYIKAKEDLLAALDNVLKNQAAAPDKHKFDSRTFVRPKRRPQRPSIQSIVEVNPAMSPHQSLNQSANKYLTYNKYNNPLGPISPMLRLKTFNVDVNTENSNVIKEFAVKRRGMALDDDPQLEDGDTSEDRTSDHTRFKPINIDYSQPANNIHNTFNKGLNMFADRNSLNMYQSGESLMRMSPPSLVSSLVMENSGNFNHDSLEGKKSLPHRDSGPPTIGRESLNPMMTSMTLSILDDKDMNTSFLSQTTHPDNDSLLDSLPPSLVNSVNSSYIVSNTSRKADTPDTNIFSSATFTRLEQSEKLLAARPRCQLFNTFKRDSIKTSESYTKAREEACQIDTAKVLNENSDNSKESPKRNGEMSETITLHFSNKFRDTDAEKENVNTTFEKDDAFFNEVEVQRLEGKTSLNVTMEKQELNEIIQARQKLSLARKALPEADKSPSDTSPIKTIQLPNQTITVPRQSMENAAELLTRRRVMKQEESLREPPKRNATFKKPSPKTNQIDSTVVYVKSNETHIIDINSATMNLIDSAERTLNPDDWGLEDRAMVGSTESAETDTGTFSSSSPPDHADPNLHVASTPLVLKKGTKNELLNLHHTISPIYDITDQSYTVIKVPDGNGMERTFDLNTTVINSGTVVRRAAPKRDILTGKSTPEKKITGPVQQKPNTIPSSAGVVRTMPPPTCVPTKMALPTSKLRQYSSHRELNRIPAGRTIPGIPGRTMVRRNVYASNPALSPTAPAQPITQLPQRRQSVVIPPPQHEENVDMHVEKLSKPAFTAPPALVRQGTETLRRERPQSQLAQPKDLRLSATPIATGVPVSMRNHYAPPPCSRPSSIACASQLRVSRPTSVPSRQVPVPAQMEPQRPQTGLESRASALPRPSRLPAPRRMLRPPSVYSVAPTADVDQY
ncbi:uncharacterized protein LOC125051628 isoform X2 [Pieris napi]|uniref:uncharacterized protein LOC125051628 isoform X2 n=1 Tax=Pieris napi TaxID=78633 RepID=UPI001FBA0B74|nr:uncharacterized protein LOC125051628 isoform X2 [Pieris napi]